MARILEAVMALVSLVLVAVVAEVVAPIGEALVEVVPTA